VLVEAAYRTYSEAMLQAMVYFCGDEQAAKDGVSHAFTQALARKQLLESMPEPAMKAWLYAAARNAVVDIKRREARFSCLPDEDACRSNGLSVFADIRSDPADRAAVEALVEKLPPALRAPVRMKYFGGMNASEIGRAMNLPPGNGTDQAADGATLEDARAGDLKITCDSLLIYEDLDTALGDLFTCSNRELVPPGYEITGNLESAKLPLYGPKVYIDGDFTMEAGDLPLLEKIENIIVKGRAELPSPTAETFRKKGRANDYYVFEGRLRRINGFEQYSHGQLAASSTAGEKLTIIVNGCLLFDEDVSAEDTACIASLSYNGAVLVPATVKAALASKVREANGFMGDPALIEKTTGRNIRNFITGQTGGDSKNEQKDTSTINAGTYLLI
jgi:DNA-directed RNA polymerase specialized sigma24 family protein